MRRGLRQAIQQHFHLTVVGEAAMVEMTVGLSKAFTRETDDAPEPPARSRQSSRLPPGAKNYLTPDGAARLQAQLERLTQIERPKLTQASNDPVARQRLQGLDQQVQRLRESLATAVIVQPPGPPWDQVHFGATVVVRGGRSRETRYRIVGIDETDLDRDWVSWLSPIAKALLNAGLRQRIRFHFPSGEEDLEVVSIEYFTTGI